MFLLLCFFSDALQLSSEVFWVTGCRIRWAGLPQKKPWQWLSVSSSSTRQRAKPTRYCLICLLPKQSRLYYIVLYCIVLYCIVLYCIVLYCIILYGIVLWVYYIILYYVVLCCVVLCCVVLCCVVLCYIIPFHVIFVDILGYSLHTFKNLHVLMLVSLCWLWSGMYA